MKEAGLPAPIFQTAGIFTVILRRPQKTTRKTGDRILDVLKTNPQASREQIALILGSVSEDGVKYQLNSLKKQGKIRRIGPARGGYWEVVETKKPT